MPGLVGGAHFSGFSFDCPFYSAKLHATLTKGNAISLSLPASLHTPAYLPPYTPPISLHTPAYLPPYTCLSPSIHLPISLHTPAYLPPYTCLSPSIHLPISLHTPAYLPPYTCLPPSIHLPISLHTPAYLPPYTCLSPSIHLPISLHTHRLSPSIHLPASLHTPAYLPPYTPPISLHTPACLPPYTCLSPSIHTAYLPPYTPPALIPREMACTYETGATRSHFTCSQTDCPKLQASQTLRHLSMYIFISYSKINQGGANCHLQPPPPHHLQHQKPNTKRKDKP